MRRIISLFLFLTMLLPSILILTACNDGEDPPEQTPENPPEEKAPALYLPTPGSFAGHSAENFSTMVYSSPSVEELTSALSHATDMLLSEETDYAEAIENLDRAQAVFAAYTEMLEYARICYSQNTANTYFAAEYKRLYEASPTVCFYMERLFSAAAASAHGAALAETDYLPANLLSRYGGEYIYTALTLPLFEQETELLIQTETISPDTISIELNELSGTLTSVLTQLANTFGKNSAEYQQAALRCQALYAKKANQRRAELYLSLLSVRREIANALGFESYAVFAAEKLGYEADTEEISATLDAVEDYILPVYRALTSAGFFTADTGKVEKIRYPEAMLNTLTAFYEKKGGKIFEGYNYLLQKGLFSLGENSDTRAVGGYATYLPDRAQPFLFISAAGTAADYLSVAENVGNALYYYYNGKENTAFSAETGTTELSNALGMALRLLTLEGMEAALSDAQSAMDISTYLVLLKSEIYNILRTVLTESMRTQIELEAYALEADEISAAAVNAIIAGAAERFGCYEMQDGSFLSLSLSTEGLLTRDTFHAPMQAYASLTSAYTALQIFLAERKTDGAGFGMMEALLASDLRNGDFAAILSSLSIPRPAETGSIGSAATALYEALTGYSYEPPTTPPSLT